MLEEVNLSLVNVRIELIAAVLFVLGLNYNWAFAVILAFVFIAFEAAINIIYHKKQGTSMFSK